MDTSFLKNLSFNELTDLLREAEQVAREKNPDNIRLAKRQAEEWAKQKREDELHEQKILRIVCRLKSFLKPGMLLKMKGCKDGKGLREFIKWDSHDNLVCWQISISRQWSPKADKFLSREVNTNVVTTHMADKVQMIQLHDQLIPLNKLIG